MIKAHKIRLHPTPEQEEYFRKAAGTARFCSNWARAEYWLKTKEKLARAHYEVACTRLDWLHKLTTEIAKTSGIVGVEDLHVKGLIRRLRSAVCAVRDSPYR